MNNASIETSLRVIYESKSFDEVYEVANHLRECGSEKAIQPLLSRIEKESDPYWLRKMLLEAVYCSFPQKGIKSARYENLLLSIFTSTKEHQDVKAAAALALGYVGSKRTTRLFIKKIPDIRSPVLLHSCITALGNIGDPVAVDALVKIMKTDVSFIPQVVAKALEKIGAPAIKAVPALQILANNGNKVEKRSALEAITKINENTKESGLAD